jgi:hypothetical protein
MATKQSKQFDIGWDVFRTAAPSTIHIFFMLRFPLCGFGACGQQASRILAGPRVRG